MFTLLTVVAGLQVSRDHVPIRYTDIFDSAWTDDATMIRIDAHAFTFLDIHAWTPPITRVRSTAEFVACVSLGDEIICATLG